MADDTSTTFTLKGLAEGAYVMGLSTLGEMAEHVRCHYDAYFLIANFAAEMAAFDALIATHEDDLIALYVTPEDMKRIDAEVDACCSRFNTPDDDPWPGAG